MSFTCTAMALVLSIRDICISWGYFNAVHEVDEHLYNIRDGFFLEISSEIQKALAPTVAGAKSVHFKVALFIH